MTKYVILKHNGASSVDPIGVSEGASARSAIRAFLETGGNGEKFGEGDYRAVPQQSWPEKPYPIKKKIKFG